MEHLTKSQLILLALFVSFVTSIATGIVTVTLMDQAPPGVTQTINRVVERTIQTIVPSGSEIVKEQVMISQEDFVVDAIEKNSPSIVSVSAVNADGTHAKLGIGIMLTQGGLFVTDQTFLSRGITNLRIMYTGKEFAAETVLSDQSSPLAFLKAVAQKEEVSATTTDNEATTFTPAKLADSNAIKLGQTAIMLGGADGKQVALGIVSRLVPRESSNDTATSTPNLGAYLSIETNTSLSKDSTGGPMIAIDGSVMGITIVDGGKQFTIPSRVIAYALMQIVNAGTGTSASAALSGLSATISGFLKDMQFRGTEAGQEGEIQAGGSALTQ